MDEFNKTLDLEGLTYYDTKIKEVIDDKAPLASPTLTGTPKAPTASVGTNTTQIATTAFVQTAVSEGIAASDAMIIKGTIGTSGTVTSLPTTYKTGWTYRVVTNGTYAGQVCEIGDLVVALVDRSGSGNLDSDWCVAQTNINGAITGIKSGDAYISVSQSGSVVTITHKDVTRSNTTSTAKPSHGGTFTAVKTVTSDAKGHVTGVDTETVTLPTYGVATQSANGLESASDKTKLDGIATGAEVNQNAFSNVVVGSTTIAADSKTDTLTLAGSNVTLTPDATNDKVTIGITKANVTSALGYTPPTTNTVTTATTTGSGNAVTSITASNGALTVTKGSTFLTAHPTITTNTDTTSTASPSSGGTFTTVDSVTRDSNGHVTKVNTKTVTLPSTAVTVDSALSSTSENPVQNKVVKKALDNNAYIYYNSITSKNYISSYTSPFTLSKIMQFKYKTPDAVNVHESVINGIVSDLNALPFDDTTSTYSTLSDANTAAETSASNIKNKVGLIDFIKNAKQSFSAIIQGLKILGTNVGAIQGITDSLTATSSNVALSAAGGNNLQGQINTLNSNLKSNTDSLFTLVSSDYFAIQFLNTVKIGNFIFVCTTINILSDMTAWNQYRIATANNTSLKGSLGFMISQNTGRAYALTGGRGYDIDIRADNNPPQKDDWLRGTIFFHQP